MIFKKVEKIEDAISVIGIGCWNMGGDWDSSEERNSVQIVDAAIDAGINFFDVAPVYGWGRSEQVLGRALTVGDKRSKVLIASKGGLLWDDSHRTKNDLSKDSLVKEVDNSLKRLQTDYIDLYQLHWPDPSAPLEETADALNILKDSGKIRYVGLSNFSQKDVEQMMTMVDVDCQQSLYNMLERNTLSYHGIPLAYRTEEEVLPFVKAHGQAFLPYSPLFQGLLAGKFLEGIDFSASDIRNENPKLTGEQFKVYQNIARQLQVFSQKMGRGMNEVALNWLRQKQEVTSIIGGVSSIAQLEKNMYCLTWDISDNEMQEINRIIEPVKNI